ncbi:MAG: nucleoside triphosphate pyrophosphohydrolase [Clostridiales bacterium]|nr:nucleoside triphosphate pyrophosphohydrolase [Clostridiales bacterium]
MGSIAIVGVDGPLGDVPPRSLERLRAAETVVVPSASGPLIETLAAHGIEYVTLAGLGVSAQASTPEVVDALVRRAEAGDVAIVSLGYPLLRGGLVTGLLDRSNTTVDVSPTVSPLHVILMALDVDLTADLDIIDARSLAPSVEQRTSHLIVTGVSNKLLAKRVSERLLSCYQPDHPVVVAAGDEGGYALTRATVGSLAAIDPHQGSAVFVPPSRVDRIADFYGFVRTIETLRGPDGCPWDRIQDHMSLRRNMIEEAYEAVAAIEAGDSAGLAEELGDVLLQIVLHAQIAAEEDRFTVEDVVGGIHEKIRRRHPHVFGGTVAGTVGEVTETWDAIKRDEKDGAEVLAGIPAALPALMWAQKISRRAAGAGFEWETLDDVWEKVHEELDELRAAKPGSPDAAGEIGDLLFTIVNLARKQGIDAEEALRATCTKFIGRFEHMEREAGERGERLSEVGIEVMERLWRDAKNREGLDR